MNLKEKTSISRRLKLTKKILEDKGWIQNSYHSENGYCLRAAVQKAEEIISHKPIYHLSKHYVTTLKTIAKYITSGNIIYFNDLSTTTKDQVLEILDKAIKETE